MKFCFTIKSPCSTPKAMVFASSTLSLHRKYRSKIEEMQDFQIQALVKGLIPIVTMSCIYYNKLINRSYNLYTPMVGQWTLSSSVLPVKAEVYIVVLTFLERLSNFPFCNLVQLVGIKHHQGIKDYVFSTHTSEPFK